MAEASAHRAPCQQARGMIHLDTSFIILALAPGSAEDRKLRKGLQNRESLAMSAIAWAEILCGPLPLELVQVAARIVPERVPFDDVDAELAAQLFSDSRRRGGTFVDCMSTEMHSVETDCTASDCCGSR